MEKEFVIGFVIYKPEFSFLKRLENIIDLGYKIYIFDNSPQVDYVRSIISQFKNVKYFTCGKNAGLGFGLSVICAQAYYEKNTKLLFLDQDTIFTRDTLNYIGGFLKDNNNLEEDYSSIMFSSKYKGKSEQYLFTDIKISINSGSVFFLKNLLRLGWHNTSYFVDCVDYEFCLRSNNAMYKIGEVSNTPGFDHETDQGSLNYRLFGKIRSLRRYSVKRMIDTFIASNRIIFTSIVTHNAHFFLIMVKFLIMYFFWQAIVRIAIMFKLKERNV